MSKEQRNKILNALEAYPNTEHQRCWNQRIASIDARLPKRLRAEARHRLREMAREGSYEICA